MNARRRRRRLVITLDSAELDTTELDRITRLARQLDAEIEAVFIEDADVLQLAELPIAQEFRPGSMSLGRVDAARIEQELQAAARRAHRLLAHVTGEHDVPWQFRVWRGSLERELLTTLEADILALSRLGALFARTQRHGRCGVAVTIDGSDATDRALETAGALASEPHVPLTVLLHGVADDEARALRKRAAERLADLQPPPQYIKLPEASLPALARALRDSTSAVLVMDRQSPLLQYGSLRETLERVGCSLFLVS